MNSLQLHVDGYEVTALVDTGAVYSIFREGIVARLRRVTAKWDGPQRPTAGGLLIMPLARCTEEVEYAENRFKLKFFDLSRCARVVILGLDLILITAKLLAFTRERFHSVESSGNL